MKKPHSKKFKGTPKQKKRFFKRSQGQKKDATKSSREGIKFPSISRLFTDKRGSPGSGMAARIIPEISFTSFEKAIWNRYFLVSVVATIIGVAIIFQGISLAKHISELETIRSEREQVRKEIAYWDGVIKSHEDYRDGYFKLALLYYRLGNREMAQIYTEKTLIIDPNFTPALEFLEKIEAKD